MQVSARLYITPAIFYAYFSAGDMVFKTGNVATFLKLIFYLKCVCVCVLFVNKQINKCYGLNYIPPKFIG